MIFSLAAGCGVKMSQLPVLSRPYAAKLELFQHIENRDGKLKKKKFKNDRVTSPFYFLLEVKEVENQGSMSVRFYDPDGEIAAHRRFNFGKAGMYYEYIMFFDRVEGFSPGRYRYAVFIDDRLLYEDHFYINPPPVEKKRGF